MEEGPVTQQAPPPIEVTVERLGLEGEGIASHEGRALFVPGAFPGERVLVHLEPPSRVRRARLERVITPSPSRRSPPCALAERCGGCDWMQLKPSAQVPEKERLVVDALEHLGGIPPQSYTLHPTAATGTDTGTRRRAVLHWEPRGLAYYGRRSHETVEVDACPALVEALEALPGRLSTPLKPLGGTLQAVHLLAEGASVSLALALKGPVRPKAREVAEGLIRLGLAQGVVLLDGEGRSEEMGRPVLEGSAPQAPGVRLRVRADAFAQAHAEGVNALVERALDFLEARLEDRALELYSGNGTFTFALAARVHSVLAVESSASSLALAASAGRASAVGNIRWVQGDARRVCEGLVKEGTRFNVLLVDPPRSGAPKLAESARALGVRGLVYVGCDAGSLARDAGRLVAAGFRLAGVQLVDLFPNTHHVEALLAFEV